jgi:hypothetical protein
LVKCGFGQATTRAPSLGSIISGRSCSNYGMLPISEARVHHQTSPLQPSRSRVRLSGARRYYPSYHMRRADGDCRALCLDYRRDLPEIERTYFSSLGNSLWNHGRTRLQLQMDGLLRLLEMTPGEVSDAARYFCKWAACRKETPLPDTSCYANQVIGRQGGNPDCQL